jgi:hypothetical protein
MTVVGVSAFTVCVFATAGYCALAGVVAVGLGVANDRYANHQSWGQILPKVGVNMLLVAMTGGASGIGDELVAQGLLSRLGGRLMNGVLGFPGSLCVASGKC